MKAFEEVEHRAVLVLEQPARDMDGAVYERNINDLKARLVRRALVLLVVALSVLTTEAATLAWTESLR